LRENTFTVSGLMSRMTAPDGDLFAVEQFFFPFQHRRPPKNFLKVKKFVLSNKFTPGCQGKRTRNSKAPWAHRALQVGGGAF